jgi:hypothetical protein
VSANVPTTKAVIANGDLSRCRLWAVKTRAIVFAVHGKKPEEVRRLRPHI